VDEGLKTHSGIERSETGKIPGRVFMSRQQKKESRRYRSPYGKGVWSRVGENREAESEGKV